MLVAAITTNPRCERLPFCVAVQKGKGSGLKHKSYINLSHIHAFSKDRLQKKLGKLSNEKMADVDAAFRLMLNL